MRSATYPSVDIAVSSAQKCSRRTISYKGISKKYMLLKSPSYVLNVAEASALTGVCKSIYKFIKVKRNSSALNVTTHAILPLVFAHMSWKDIQQETINMCVMFVGKVLQKNMVYLDTRSESTKFNNCLVNYVQRNFPVMRTFFSISKAIIMINPLSVIPVRRLSPMCGVYKDMYNHINRTAILSVRSVHCSSHERIH